MTRDTLLNRIETPEPVVMVEVLQIDRGQSGSVGHRRLVADAHIVDRFSALTAALLGYC